MALIPCRECGENISDQAVACPKCGCPVQPIQSAFVNPQMQYQNQTGFQQNQQMGFQQNQQMGFQQPQQPIYIKKKDSTLSIIAAACTLFTITCPIGIILGIIDIAAYCHDGKKHVGSWFAIIFGIVIVCVGMCWYYTRRH